MDVIFGKVNWMLTKSDSRNQHSTTETKLRKSLIYVELGVLTILGFLSAQSEKSPAVAGLQSGADYCIDIHGQKV